MEKVTLYIGSCIGDLNKKAVYNFDPSRSTKIHINHSEKTYQAAEEARLKGDEERGYILYMRYLDIFQKVRSSRGYKKDESHYSLLLGTSKVGKAISHAEGLAESLRERYDAVKKSLSCGRSDSTIESSAKSSIKPYREHKAPSEDASVTQDQCYPLSSKEEPRIKQHLIPPDAKSITREELYEVLFSKKNSESLILLIDIRLHNEFASSHIRHSCCINIPKVAIKPGTVCKRIEEGIVDHNHLDMWRRRNDMDFIVLIDWFSNPEDLDDISCPLRSLTDALTKWEQEIMLKRGPVVLIGGYANWLDYYPQFSTNPRVERPRLQPKGVMSVTSLADFCYNDLIAPPADADETLISEDADSKDNSADPHNDAKDVPGEMDLPEAKHHVDKNIPVVNRATKPVQVASQSGASLFKQAGSPPASNYSFSDLDDIFSIQSQIEGSSKESEFIEEEKNVPKNNKIATESSMRQKRIDKPKKYEENKSDLNTTEAAQNQIEPEQQKKKDVKEKRRVTELQKRLLIQEDRNRLMEKKLAEAMRRVGKPVASNKPHQEIDGTTNQSTKNNEKSIQNVSSTVDNEEYMENRKLPDENDLPILNKEQQDPTKKTVPSGFKTSPDCKQQGQSTQESHTVLATKRPENKKPEIDRYGKHKGTNSGADKKSQNSDQPPAKPTVLKNEQALQDTQEKSPPVSHSMNPIEKKPQVKKSSKHLSNGNEVRNKSHPKMDPVIISSKKNSVVTNNRDEVNINPDTLMKPVAPRALPKLPSGSQQDGRAAVALPLNWEKRLDKKTGRYYYLDHDTKTTHWMLPDNILKPKKISPATKIGGGLKRSSSTPNIAQLIDDEVVRPKPSVPSREFKPRNEREAIPDPPDEYAQRLSRLHPAFGGCGPGLCGLQNLGNTCYMNSVLQCMFNTAFLARYFLTNKYKRDINRDNFLGSGGEITDGFALLMKASWEGKFKHLTPRDFRLTVAKFNPRFGGYSQQDSQELLLFLMDGLHEDLNLITERRYEEEDDNDELRDQMAAEKAWQHHKRLNKSIIVELFQGQFKATVQCLYCHKKSRKFDVFMYLSLPLPSHSCSIYDCIEKFSESEKLSGDNKWRCPSCKTEREALRRMEIWKLPSVLLIHFKRFSFCGRWGDKVQTAVKYPTDGLNLSKYVKGPKLAKTYQLYSVSHHHGASLDSGHYVASCKNPVDGNWYKYDDHEVSRTSVPQGPSSYILCYTSVKHNLDLAYT